MSHDAAPLFAGWEKGMILSCLQGHMGQVRTGGGHPPESALCAIGDFCFFAGRPDPALVRQADRPLLVPRTGDWAPVIRAVWGRRAVPFLRYALCGAPEDFDRDRLAAFAAALAEKLAARDEERYGPAAQQLRAKADRALMRQREKRQHEKNMRQGKHKPWAAPPSRSSKREEAPPTASRRERGKGGSGRRPGRPETGTGRAPRTFPGKPGPGGRKLTAKPRSGGRNPAGKP